MACLMMSGQIGSGKTAVAECVASHNGGTVVRVREALRSILGTDGTDRLVMQREGAELDQRTNGRWLLDFLEELSEKSPLLVVDAVRTRRQTLPILERMADTRLVYLNAHESIRRDRYERAALTDELKRSVPFDVAMRHATEREVLNLRPLAHLVVDTDDLEPPAIGRLAAGTLPPPAPN